MSPYLSAPFGACLIHMSNIPTTVACNWLTVIRIQYPVSRNIHVGRKVFVQFHHNHFNPVNHRVAVRLRLCFIMNRDYFPIKCQSYSKGFIFCTSGDRLAIRIRRIPMPATSRITIDISPVTCLYSTRPFVDCSTFCTYVSSSNFRNTCLFFFIILYHS